MRLGLAVAAYRGNSDVDLKRLEDAADMFCDMATLQGSCWRRKLPISFGKRLPGSS
jgi:hypothetical protein